MKKNKAAAEAWREDTRAEAQAKEDLSDQETALFYAANKRDGGNWPYPATLKKLGFDDAASKVAQAYRLLEEAEYSFLKQKNPELYGQG